MTQGYFANRVVTWQSPNGYRIDVSLAQEELLRQRGTWPKDPRGEEYCSVHHGTRHGQPSHTDTELLALCR